MKDISDNKKEARWIAAVVAYLINIPLGTTLYMKLGISTYSIVTSFLMYFGMYLFTRFIADLIVEHRQLKKEIKEEESGEEE